LVGLGASIALLAVCVAYALRNIDVAQLKHAFARADITWIVLATVFVAISLWLLAVRTAFVLRAYGASDLTVPAVFRLQLIALFLSYSVPIGGAVDVARVGMYALRFHLSVRDSSCAVIIERLAGLFGILLAFALTLPFEAFFRLSPTIVIYQLLGGASIIGLTLGLMAAVKIGSRMPIAVIRRISGFFGPILPFIQSPGNVLVQGLVAMAGILAICGSIYCLSQAFAAGFTIPMVLVFTPVVLVANYMPFLYAGWGGREMAFLLTFATAPTTTVESTLVVSVTFGILFLLVSLPGAVFWLTRPRFVKTAKATHSYSEA
jgi:uncharacterized membrane protein YbhN (UPF0104 family)